MNNLEHAIEILEREHDPATGQIDAPSLAYALHDAGLIAPDPDLAHTVIEQAARIARQAETIQTLSRLLAGAEEAATERADQIVRLQAAVRELTHDPHWLTVVGVLKEGDMK